MKQHGYEWKEEYMNMMMNERGYSEQYRPLSAWAYFGLTLLYAIPVIGWIFLIVFTFSRKNINRRSFTRSFWIFALFFIIVSIISGSILFVTGSDLLKNIRTYLPDNIGGLNTFAERSANGLTTSKSVPATELPRTENTGRTTLVSLTELSAGKIQSQLSSGKSHSSFKDAMDSYERFFSEYVDFMREYTEKEQPISMLVDYGKMMQRYFEAMSGLEKINDEDLDSSDAAYYLEVTARIYKKLGELGNP